MTKTMPKSLVLFYFFQFKEISFAYEVLSNPEKRETYDRYGIQGLKEGAGGGKFVTKVFLGHCLQCMSVSK